MLLPNDVIIHHFMKYVKIENTIYYYNVNKLFNISKIYYYDKDKIFNLLLECCKNNNLILLKKLLNKFQNFDTNIKKSYLFRYSMSKCNIFFVKYFYERNNDIKNIHDGLVGAIQNNRYENVIWYIENIVSLRKYNNNYWIFEKCTKYCRNNNKSLLYLYENLEYKSDHVLFEELLIESLPWIIYRLNYSFFLYLINKYPNILTHGGIISELERYPFYEYYSEFLNHPDIKNHPQITNNIILQEFIKGL